MNHPQLQTPGAEILKMLEDGSQFNDSAASRDNSELHAFLADSNNPSADPKEGEDFKKLKSGLFNNREVLMGSTIRDLGNTIKEAQNFLKSKRAGELQIDQMMIEGV